MSNLMSNIYIGLVAEIIKENGKPTLDIRVRIPSLHIGLKDEDLPIAKPIIVPGMLVDPIHFENYFSRVNRVYVIFDSGSKAMPRYFGALGEGASTIIPEESTGGPVGLADVAYSGSYNDLIDKPDIADMATKVDKENVVDTFGTISSELIPSTKAVSERYVLSIDEPIPDLNNDTLREVFEDGTVTEPGFYYNLYKALTQAINKVDKVEGKGLSTEDFTTALKIKLEAAETIFVGSAEPDPTENKLWFAIE